MSGLQQVMEVKDRDGAMNLDIYQLKFRLAKKNMRNKNFTFNNTGVFESVSMLRNVSFAMSNLCI